MSVRRSEFWHSLVLALLLWLGLGASAAAAAPEAPAFEARKALEPLPLRVSIEPELRALGKALYFDPRLGGDGETHCGSCHALPPIAEGVPDIDTQPEGRLGRSIPLLYNVGEYYWYNWDGRYRSLEALLSAAIPDLEKMNIQWSLAIQRLRPGYAEDFAQVTGEAFSRQAVIDALALFLRSLNTPNARFDRFLRGEMDALTAREKQGLKLFRELGCISCHNGRSLGANFFEKFYIYRHEGGEEGEERLQDLGRFYVTGEGSDRNLFRVPSLRNVALSPPYFHDGSAPDLEEAIEEMAEHQLGILIQDEEIDALIAFLKTLTGEHPGVEQP